MHKKCAVLKRNLMKALIVCVFIWEHWFCEKGASYDLAKAPAVLRRGFAGGLLLHLTRA
jgi:hypothetical protein